MSASSLNFKTVVYSSLGNLAVPLSALITGPLLARALGPAGRGEMAALLVPVSLANVMFTFGLPEALAFHTAAAKIDGLKASKIAVTGGLAAGVVASVCVLIAAPHLFPSYKIHSTGFIMLICSLPITLTFAAARGIVLGERKYNLISTEHVIAVLCRVVALIIFIAVGWLSPISATWISIGSGIVGSLVLIPSLRLAKNRAGKLGSFKDVASYAGTVALGTFGGFVVLRLDQALMISLTNFAEIGYYAVAVSLAELPLTVITAIRDLVFTEAAQCQDPIMTARLCRMTLFVAIGVCLIGAAFTPLLLPLFFGRRFQPAVLMAEILLAGTVVSVVSAILGAGLMTSGKSLSQSLIQLLGAATTAVSLFIFVPRYGGLGAAVISTLTYLVLATATAAVYVRSTGMNLSECIISKRSDIVHLSSLLFLRYRRTLVQMEN